MISESEIDEICATHFESIVLLLLRQIALRLGVQDVSEEGEDE